MRIGVTKERLMDLQRTVDTLQGRVQEMQCEMRHVQRHSPERWWRSLLKIRQGEAFMSSCCNRRVRPNTKVVNYVGTRRDQ